MYTFLTLCCAISSFFLPLQTHTHTVTMSTSTTTEYSPTNGVEISSTVSVTLLPSNPGVNDTGKTIILYMVGNLGGDKLW